MTELNNLESIKGYSFVMPPSPNIKISFGDSTTWFQFHSNTIPNRFQRWMLLKLLGIKVEKI